ncbi:FUSC family protein [Nonomuraea aridisoli]|uniref:Integral membrane bound transporter domain-containing protein n=1 Tax=Nonomuraea aridisoli TaxID=2070368 RepID=A0A2W2DPF5_9ACTN|nr:FUSC family protein [Nonomuraea aridisoli]PZG12251.1 hypothetical protein C1J01_33280 [Nonomuraea aridisoli]
MTDHQHRAPFGDGRSAWGNLRRIQWRELLRVGPFHWSDVTLQRALRVGVGTMLPLAVGAAAGHLDYGAFMSLGALPAGFASFQGVTRTRVAVVAAATAGMAVSTFVGATTVAAAPWLLVPVVMLWGYVTGLAVCLGRRMSVAVLQWATALMVGVGLPMEPSEAALRAALVVAGGLFQGALVALSWLLRPGAAERAALAESYRSLADYAAGLAAGGSDPPPSDAFPAAAVLADPNPLLPHPVRLAFLDLLEQAERIRASLAAFAEHAADEPAEPVRDFATAVTRALDAVADALSARRGDRAERVRVLDGLLPQPAVPPDTRWEWTAESVLGLLRAVTGILARLHGVPVRTGAAGVPSGQPTMPVGQEAITWTALALRANLTPTGETGRHAIRVAVAAGLAELMVQTTGLFEGRWVVLTIFLVLKPDFASTAERSVQRAVGTAAGAFLGAVLAGLVHPHPVGLIIGATVFVTVGYAVFNVSYLLFSTSLTVYLVILLDILGTPGATAATERLADTVIGSAIALVAYALWPSGEVLSAQETFARLVTAHGRYTTSLLRQYANPEEVDPAALRTLQAEARRARTEAEASAARLAEEPPQPAMTPAVAQTLVAAVTRLAHTELSLHTLVLEQSAVVRADARPRLDALTAALATTADALAEAIRTSREPAGLPPLRRLQAALRTPPSPLDPRYVALTDSLVDAFDTLAAVLTQTRT